MAITYRTSNPPPAAPEKPSPVSPPMGRAIRTIGHDWQQDVLDLVRRHQEYIADENASPMTADLARRSNKTMANISSALPSATLPQEIIDRFTATQGSPPELLKERADGLSAAERVWRVAHDAAMQLHETIPKRGIVGANNISIATNKSGSPAQQTWNDCADLLQRAGIKPGKRDGKAVYLARQVIEMATGKKLKLTGLRFDR